PPGGVPGGVHGGDGLVPVAGERIRALGTVPGGLRAAAAQVGASVVDTPVVLDGRREMPSVLREQAVSRTRHRFGHLER
ncbi:hypothetical protein, partial [Pseudonocardia sp. SID8383]